MNSELEDPNNHVPRVSAEDDWDETVGFRSDFKTSLPPRRSEKVSVPRLKSQQETGGDDEPRLLLVEFDAEDEDGAKGETEGWEPKKVISEKRSHRGFEVNRIGSAQGGRPVMEKSGLLNLGPLVRVGETGEVAEDVEVIKGRIVCGERGDWGAWRRGSTLRWMVYGGVCVVVLVLFAVVAGEMIRDGNPEAEPPDFGLVEVADQDEGGLEGDDGALFFAKRFVEAKALYGRFAAAVSVEELESLIYDYGGFVEELRLNWQPLGGRRDWQAGDDCFWTVDERAGLFFARLDGMDSKRRPFSAFFRKEDGRMKVDWKATVGYGSDSFKRLARGEGDASELRVWLSEGDFHTFSMPESEYRAFWLASPDESETLWGYSRRGSEMDGKLMASFTAGSFIDKQVRSARVILALERGREDSLPNQWMIRDLLHIGWIGDYKPRGD